MNDLSRAKFVRFVAPTETIEELGSALKSLTWSEHAEHAVLVLEREQRVIVRGSRNGIDLQVDTGVDPQGRISHTLWINVDGKPMRVVRLVLHTHPQPSGPSDDDLRVMLILGQSESLLFEIFGPPEGTIIRPKSSR